MHPMVSYLEVIGGDHSNNGNPRSRAGARRVQNIVKVCDGRSVILFFFMHDVNTRFWKMYQIIPPAWRTHLGNHLFELGKWATYFLTTGYGLKNNWYAISMFQKRSNFVYLIWTWERGKSGRVRLTCYTIMAQIFSEACIFMN